MQAIVEADQSSLEPAARKSGHIVGCIDDINECGIYGWAYDAKAPDCAVTLQFYVDGAWIDDVLCSALREDVASAGYPASEVGFHISVPEILCDGKPHVMLLRDQDGQDALLSREQQPAVAEHSFTIATYFDATFYAAHYLLSEAANGLRELEHWKTQGAAAGNFPNPRAMLAALAARGRALPEDFSPQHYRFLNRDLGDSVTLDWQAQLHYLQFGIKESRPYKIEYGDFVSELYLDGKPATTDDMERISGEAGLYHSVLDMFTRNKFTSSSFLSHFKVEDYIAFYPAVRFNNRLQCIRHFVETGREAMCPIAFDLVFDATFYTEIAQLSPSTTGPDAYLHWLNFGIDHGLPPGPASALRRMGLNRTHEFPTTFEPRIYAALNPDLEELRKQNRWDALRSLLDRGLADGRPGCPLDETTCDIYLVVADRLAIAKSFQSARRLYEKVLAGFPENTMALRHYADCLLKLTEYYQAAVIYQKTIDLGRDNVWTHINQATCFVRLRRWADAAAAMSRISDRRPGDFGLANQYHDIAREGFDALSGEATWLAQNGFYDEARARMGEACGILTRRLIQHADDAAPEAAGPVSRLAIIADLGLPLCRFYRVTQKCEQLTAGGIDYRVFDYMTEIPAYLENCGDFDAVLLYRVSMTPMLARAVEAARRAGQPIFYEIDDLMFDPTCFPASFASYGGQISHDEYASLVVGSICIRSVLSVCDFGIASTTKLAEAMAPLTIRGRCFVHRNAMGRAHQRSVAQSGAGAEGEVRLFYGTGTKAHNEDFESQIVPCLVRLFAKHRSGLRLVVMGHLTLPDSLKPYQDRITQLDPIWDIEVYWSVLKTMSINIAVLSPGRVADCKSEIKWLEAAMFEVPSVVTATATYQETIRDGETGILIRDSGQWFSALDKLIGSSAKRRAIGAAARKDAVAKYDLPPMASNIVSILNGVSNGKRQVPAVRRHRILVVNVFFPPQSFGGATRVVADNITDLLEAFGDEFEVEVFTSVEGRTIPYQLTTYRWAGVRVTGISTPVDPDINMKVVDEPMGRAFAAVLERFAPDLIHFHCIQRLTTSLCSTAVEMNIPYVITLHDAWWLSDRQFIVDEFGREHFYNFKDMLGELRAGGDMSLKRMLVKQKCLRAAAGLFAVSDPFERIYRAHGFDNVIAIENGLPPFTRPARSPSPDGIVRIAHIGGTSYHKGYHLLVAVLMSGHFPNLRHLQIDHSLEAGTERTDRWGDTDVVIKSSVPQHEVGTLYANIDVLLAPSIWPESYGLVVREALAAGCWVVTSDRGAVGQDVPKGAGFVIDVGSDGPLRDVLQRINDDPATFTQPPQVELSLRTARQQAIDLAGEYRRLKRRLAGEVDAAPVATPQQLGGASDQPRLPAGGMSKKRALSKRA